MMRFRAKCTSTMNKCRIGLIFIFLLSFGLNLCLWKQSKITEVTTNVKFSSSLTALFSKNGFQTQNVVHILPASQSFLILPPKDICKEGTKLVFVVKSKVDHFSDRQKIRRSWGRMRKNLSSVKVVFLVAYPGVEANDISELLHEESQQHNDIVQGSFLEAYRNLTMKSIMGLRWFSLYCRNASYMMSVDDDFHIDLNTILSTYLNKSAPISKKGILHCGKISKNATVKRTGKWAVPESMYSEENYPDYCYGFCYIMSHDVASELYWTSLKVDTNLDIDDVLITGILRKTSPMKIELQKMPKKSCTCVKNSLGAKTCGIIKIPKKDRSNATVIEKH